MGGSADTATLRPLASGAPAKPQAAAPPRAGPVGGGGMVVRILKLILALCLIPACVGLTEGLYEHFGGLWSRLNFAVAGPGMLFKWFAFGALSFTCFAVLLWRPVVVYVFGHELVHAIATWMCMGKVTNLSASANGGQVTTSKSNTFIRLAPYCVPLYALMAAGIYFALHAWWRPLNDQIGWLACALGFFYTFHLGFTLWSLRRDQPDLKPDGWLFSLVIIYIANLAVFALLVGFLSRGNPSGAWETLRDSALNGWKHSFQLYRNLYSVFQDVLNNGRI